MIRRKGAPFRGPRTPCNTFETTLNQCKTCVPCDEQNVCDDFASARHGLRRREWLPDPYANLIDPKTPLRSSGTSQFEVLRLRLG